MDNNIPSNQEIQKTLARMVNEWSDVMEVPKHIDIRLSKSLKKVFAYCHSTTKGEADGIYKSRITFSLPALQIN